MNSSSVTDLGKLFYLIDPGETYLFDTIDNVPKYFQQAWPHFGLLMLLEYVVLWIQGKPKPRFSDTFTSLSLGLVQECGRVLFRGMEMYLYIYIYQNYRVVDLPWNSFTLWYLTAVLVDFGYYWVHRASHEFNILWAQHQVHHSSDDFNLSVGLRQGILNPWISALIYAPLALVIAPAQFIAHQQFNVMFQFWVHTETINTLGPLEWVLNTPQHHRVHHGCNKYLVDKNYGGVLIIWDRLFGTFQAKLPEDTVYGLVYPPNRFNPVTLQTYYFAGLWKKFLGQKQWINKVSSIIKGPSWTPGSPWTGFHELKKEIYTREKFTIQISTWKKIYLTIHFLLTLKGFQDICRDSSSWTATAFSIFVIFSLSNYGFILEDRPWACILEFVRCLGFLVAFKHPKAPGTTDLFTLQYMNLSVALWAVYCLNQWVMKPNKQKAF